jgi:hypothetical protein
MIVVYTWLDFNGVTAIYNSLFTLQFCSENYNNRQNNIFYMINSFILF